MRGKRFEISDRRLRRLEVLTDARLDYFAERFAAKKIRPLTLATFEAYLRNPEYWELLAESLAEGGSLQWVEIGSCWPSRLPRAEASSGSNPTTASGCCT